MGPADGQRQQSVFRNEDVRENFENSAKNTPSEEQD
jgi:hypothetical protein